MAWNTSPIDALTTLRCGLAAFGIAACALVGMKTHCFDIIDTDLVALALVAALQLVSALFSFAKAIVAWARRDITSAGIEALVGLGMLLAIPLAVGALVGSMPACVMPWVDGP